MRRSPLLLLSLLIACGSPRPADKRDGNAGPAPSASGSAALVTDPSIPDLPRDPREPVLADAAQSLLGHEHVLAHVIDDGVSKEAFKQFVEQLDGGKLFFLESDAAKLAKFETDMDDEVKAGDLTLGRKGVSLMMQRRKVVADLIAKTLATPLDFTTAEQIETDPKKRSFCKTEDELAARWRGVLKLDVLERAQELEDTLDRKQHPKPEDKPSSDPDDLKREAAAEKALGDIPATFEGRRDKVQKELATRFATQFVRLANVDKLEPASDFINALNAAFDPHTNYLPPQEEADFDIAITGRLEGIGATLREQDHYVLVNDLVAGGAAWQQGKLEVGDLIMAVAQENKDPVDVTDMPIGKVVSMIRGPKGTVVILTVKKSDASVKTISITRDVVRIEATYARGAMLKTKTLGDVGYVHLPGFYGESGKNKKPGERNATDDMRSILQQLKKQGAKSLVFDLRGDGGGLLQHARDIAGLFIKEGPVVQTKDGKGSIQVLKDADPSVTFDGPVVVLVDRFVASAAEIVAGALQDYDRAVIVGTSATHGKGTVQVVIDLDQQIQKKGEPLGVYKVTIEEYFRVSGGSTQLKGVVPDVLLPDPTSYIDSGERTLPHAIPWSTIQPAQYTKVPHAWKVPDLQTASTARTSANADLTTVTKFAKLMEQRKDKTLVSVQRDAWVTEYKRMKAELDALDPKKHEPKPLMEVVSLPSADAAPTSPDPRIQKRLDKWKDTLAKDLWVEEVTHVLADMQKAH